MRKDDMAPVIGLLDCAGIVNRWSFQPGTVMRDGGNGGVMKDGSRTRDIMAWKLKHTWTFNAMTAGTLAKLHEEIDQESVLCEMFDQRIGERREMECMADMTDPPYAFTDDKGRVRFEAGGSLTLEEV